MHNTLILQDFIAEHPERMNNATTKYIQRHAKNGH